MKYIDILNKFGKCYDPFLHIQKEEIVDESKNFFVIAARSPYIKNHLLIIPKRKVFLIWELNSTEKEEMRELLEKWTKNLHKKHKDVNLLLRDGLTVWNIWKSINHLHFHLIPDCSIWAENTLRVSERERLDDDNYIKITKKIKKDFL
jgi:diadenosine tetraphosphate (Ap4A) HIT family hydrolase